MVVCVCVLAGRVERSEGGTGEVWFSGIGEAVGGCEGWGWDDSKPPLETLL